MGQGGVEGLAFELLVGSGRAEPFERGEPRWRFGSGWAVGALGVAGAGVRVGPVRRVGAGPSGRPRHRATLWPTAATPAALWRVGPVGCGWAHGAGHRGEQLGEAPGVGVAGRGLRGLLGGFGPEQLDDGLDVGAGPDEFLDGAALGGGGRARGRGRVSPAVASSTGTTGWGPIRRGATGWGGDSRGSSRSAR